MKHLYFGTIQSLAVSITLSALAADQQASSDRTVTPYARKLTEPIARNAALLTSIFRVGHSESGACLVHQLHRLDNVDLVLQRRIRMYGKSASHYSVFTSV